MRKDRNRQEQTGIDRNRQEQTGIDMIIYLIQKIIALYRNSYLMQEIKEQTRDSNDSNSLQSKHKFIYNVGILNAKGNSYIFNRQEQTKMDIRDRIRKKQTGTDRNRQEQTGLNLIYKIIAS